MSRAWFDETSGMLRFDEFAAESAAFQRIMADSVVSDEELLEHSRATVESFKALESRLSPELAKLAAEAITNLAVLYALYQQRELRSRT